MAAPSIRRTSARAPAALPGASRGSIRTRPGRRSRPPNSPARGPLEHLGSPAAAPAGGIEAGPSIRDQAAARRARLFDPFSASLARPPVAGKPITILVALEQVVDG